MGAWKEENLNIYCIPDYQKSEDYLCAFDPFKNLFEVEWKIGNYMMPPGHGRFGNEKIYIHNWLNYIDPWTGAMSGDETRLCWNLICWPRRESGKGDSHVNLASHNKLSQYNISKSEIDI